MKNKYITAVLVVMLLPLCAAAERATAADAKEIVLNFESRLENNHGGNAKFKEFQKRKEEIKAALTAGVNKQWFASMDRWETNRAITRDYTEELKEAFAGRPGFDDGDAVNKITAYFWEDRRQQGRTEDFETVTLAEFNVFFSNGGANYEFTVSAEEPYKTVRKGVVSYAEYLKDYSANLQNPVHKRNEKWFAPSRYAAYANEGLSAEFLAGAVFKAFQNRRNFHENDIITSVIVRDMDNYNKISTPVIEISFANGMNAHRYRAYTHSYAVCVKDSRAL
jgi:hypothetical protein